MSSLNLRFSVRPKHRNHSASARGDFSVNGPAQNLFWRATYPTQLCCCAVRFVNESPKALRTKRQRILRILLRSYAAALSVLSTNRLKLFGQKATYPADTPTQLCCCAVRFVSESPKALRTKRQRILRILLRSYAAALSVLSANRPKLFGQKGNVSCGYSYAAMLLRCPFCQRIAQGSSDKKATYPADTPTQLCCCAVRFVSESPKALRTKRQRILRILLRSYAAALSVLSANRPKLFGQKGRLSGI